MRTSTEDIDFYASVESVMNVIEEAAENVSRDIHTDEAFMNSNIRLFFAHASFQDAVARTFTQNDVAFRSEELIVFVADWGYQLVSKLDRMSNKFVEGWRWDRAQMRKDRADAVFYLHMETQKQQRKLTRDEVRALYPTDGFTPNVSDDVLDAVAEVYESSYGSNAFA
jgi:hypothetical protein